MSDFLEIDKFNIKELDDGAQVVFDDFEERFKALRENLHCLPTEFYQMETDFYVESCKAQTEVQKNTMKYFANELKKDQKLGAEINSVLNWQNRRRIKETFIAEQRRLKKPLPWRYDFWGNLANVFKSILAFFVPAGVVRLFIRKAKVMAGPTNAPEPETKPTDVSKSAPIYLLPYSGTGNSGAHVPASADITADADVDPVITEIKDYQPKPKPTPATQSAKVSVSRKSLIGGNK